MASQRIFLFSLLFALHHRPTQKIRSLFRLQTPPQHTPRWTCLLWVFRDISHQKKRLRGIFGLFLLRSYRAKTARHQNATCGGEHTTQPPHTRGGVYPGAWTGVILWTRPLHPHVRYSTPVFPGPVLFQGPNWVRLLQTAIKIKRLGVRSSHIVNLKADVKLRVVG